MQDYDVLGFDADCCLVKYNNVELTNAVCQAYSQDLHVEEKYPAEITQVSQE